MSSRRPLPIFLVFALSLLFGSGLIAPVAPAQAADPIVVDDFESPLRTGVDGAIAIGFNTFQDPNSNAAIGRAATPPAPALPAAGTPNNVLQIDLNVVSFAGVTHSFENAAVDRWTAQDWSAYEGISFWLYGGNTGIDLFVDVLDNRSSPPLASDDAERWSVAFKDNFSGWQEIKLPFANMTRKEIGNRAPNDGFGLTEVHGWAFGTLGTGGSRTYYIDNVSLYGVAPIRPLTVGFTAIDFRVTEGGAATVTARLNKPASETVTVQYAARSGPARAGRDYTPVAGTLTFPPNVTQQSFSLATFDDNKYQGGRGVLVELSNPTGGAALGIPPVARVTIQDDETYDPTLLDDFETYPYLWSADAKAVLTNPEIAAGAPRALPGQAAYERILEASQKNGNGAYAFGRQFAIGQDWSDAAGLSFWYYGQNSGRDISVKLQNNQNAGAGDPSTWKLAWSDEFNARAGAAPNPNIWSHEVGDGVAIGNPGWGNDELEYYTDSTDNAATDGQGNLAITAKAADGTLQCYYGPCTYTSARLLTKNKFEIAYGRVEARIKAPRGAGLWPAFWMLGTDIDQVNWPQTGEIDIMENVGRLPNQVFGTIHGPGYSGGQSYGKIYDMGKPVADDFHTFAVEWQPNKIVWYVDGIQYHQATPSDAFLQGKQWVYNHPFFMLLNVAVGGNFGGAVGADTTFPQTMLVDYVRLYQAKPQTAEFAAAFRDDFAGWQKITLPLAAFQGDEGTTLDSTSVVGLRFEAPGGLRGPILLDQLRLGCANDVTVSSLADNGAGSLRKALGSVCVGGTIRFAPALAGGTITNLSALTIGKDVTIDGAGAPGLTISGGDAVRVFEISAAAAATIRNLAISHGYGFELAGGILNNGKLTLDHVVVANNRVASSGNDFWKGGGGIYNGDGSALHLIDSTVRANTTDQVDGGGVYGFFNTRLTIERSTIAGNSAGNVGGGLRTLGNVEMLNSTLSGNASAAWHGGAIFHTDGTMHIASSTIVGNTSPGGTAGGIFVGTFTAGSPTLTLINSIVAGNSSYQCQPGPFGSGTVTATSLGHNLAGDGSCFAVASDQIAADALLGPLADNGGPTASHALLPGSPALDTADAAASPPIDQRGVSRPQGAGSDIGAFELAAP
jgi:beta-glucanase (GH16 family)